MKRDEEQIDAALERLLPCDSKREFEHTLAKVAEEFQWGEPDRITGKRDGDPIARMFWGLVTRLQEYKGPVNRTRRDGLAWTYVEREYVRLACETQREGRVRVANAYLARLLQRPETEIEYGVKMFGPAQGRTGFNL